MIGCSKTMPMTGSKSGTQYGGQNAKKTCCQAWRSADAAITMCLKVSNRLTFADQEPRRSQFYVSWRGLQDKLCDNDKLWNVIEGIQDSEV